MRMPPVMGGTRKSGFLSVQYKIYSAFYIEPRVGVVDRGASLSFPNDENKNVKSKKSENHSKPHANSFPVVSVGADRGASRLTQEMIQAANLKHDDTTCYSTLAVALHYTPR